MEISLFRQSFCTMLFASAAAALVRSAASSGTEPEVDALSMATRTLLPSMWRAILAVSTAK